MPLLAVSYWLLVVGCQLSAISYQLLVVNFGLLYRPDLQSGCDETCVCNAVLSLKQALQMPFSTIPIANRDD